MSQTPPDNDPPGDADADVVGYGKPPKAHQFKKGQSGNPKGRPKGSKNLQTILREELDREVTIVEGGVRKRRTKLELAVRQQVDKAAKGDVKAFMATTKLLGEPAGRGGDADENAGFRPNTGITYAQYESALAALLSRLAPGSNSTGEA